MPTSWGEFQIIGFERETSNGHPIETALAMVFGDPTDGTPLLRIHSQCVTGEVLGSLRCDCREQLEIAFRLIAGEGRGLVIYEHQEGRGIGLMAKLQAYELQDLGLDTIEANLRLGYGVDHRNYQLPVAILRSLGIGRVRLLSNNPDKTRALSEAGIEVAAQIPCEAAPTSHSYAYLRTKKIRMGHALSLRRRRGFASIEDAIQELAAGRMIVVVDDADRENEGDLVMAADTITPDAVNFMATHGRGLICLAMSGHRLDQLRLDPMPDSDALGGTAFAVSM
jgi:GTP cyclohydrolase II